MSSFMLCTASCRDCVAVLYEQHRRLVRQMIAERAPARAAADLESQVWVHVADRVHRGDVVLQPVPWLRTIVARTVGDHLAAELPLVPPSHAEHLTGRLAALRAAEETIHLERAIVLAAAIDVLTCEQATVLEGLYSCGRPRSEVAHDLGITRQSLWALERRGLDRLAVHLSSDRRRLLADPSRREVGWIGTSSEKREIDAGLGRRTDKHPHRGDW